MRRTFENEIRRKENRKHDDRRKTSTKEKTKTCKKKRKVERNRLHCQRERWEQWEAMNHKQNEKFNQEGKNAKMKKRKGKGEGVEFTV